MVIITHHARRRLMDRFGIVLAPAEKVAIFNAIRADLAGLVEGTGRI